MSEYACMRDLPFARLWREHNPQSLEESRNFWDLRADEFNDITHSKDKEERYGLLRYLESKGALRPGFRVLDLGCGAGRYALEFARRAGHVTGIDISPKMIAHAEANAADAGLTNAEFLALAWQNADLDASGWRSAFDLVFASMSPAIDSEETLLAMHAASRGHCFASGFIQRTDSLLLHLAGRLLPDLVIPPLPGTVFYAFNVLWQHDIHADVTCVGTEWTNVWDIPTALEEYSVQFRKFAPEKDGLRADLERELQAVADAEGKVHRTTRAKTAWLFWKAGQGA